MATIIKNFIPAKTCWQCRFLTEAEWRCLAADRHIYKSDNPKPSWCPIVEQKQGEWQIDGFVDFDDGTIQVMLKCSVCGTTQGVMTDYCPNCGASMVNEDE